PERLSTGPHRDDTTLKPKFRVARCGEIELGRAFGLWVPWVTPVALPVPGWMAVGFGLFDRLRAQGLRPIEVFPYAVFHRLNGTRPPRKTTPAGAARRVALLHEAG